MTLSPFVKQALGGLAGIGVAGLLYVAIDALQYLPASVADTPIASAQVVQSEQSERISRIADRAQRALAQEPRRLPPAAYGEATHAGAQVSSTAEPRKVEQPIPRTAPTGTPRSAYVRPQTTSTTPLPNSGPPLLLFGILAMTGAGVRTSLRRRGPVS